MTDHPPPTASATTAPVTPRPAASLLIVKTTAAGPEVLMGLRGAGHKFMPNRLVFPGGAVDPGDADAAASAELTADVAARLTRHADPRLARALAIAAARELDEETGLSLGVPPALDGLDYLCRAITPPASPVRFDAFFFTVDAARVSGALAGSGELEDLRWFGVTEALALDLAFATKSTLQRLLEWLALDDAARRARVRVPVLRERKWEAG